MRFLSALLGVVLSATAGFSQPVRWSATEYGRQAALPTPTSAEGWAGFRLLSPDETGLTFTNILGDAKASENQIRLNGSGVAIGDVNGDGRPDIYFCGLESSNALFLNLGNWRFVQATNSPDIACRGNYSTGATFADIDGDGDLDLLVNGIGTGTHLFINDGTGHFQEKKESGLHDRFGATTLALADIDGDGDLDLYVANYRTTTVRTTGFALLKAKGRLQVREEDRDQLEITPQGRILEQGEPDFLYLNDGSGRFISASWTDRRFVDEDGRALSRPPLDWGLTAAFHDLNGDLAPDLYVCNDFHSTDKIWINDGRGRFRAVGKLALRNTSTFSMAVDFADLNHDGWEDLFVADMLSPQHARRLMRLAATDPYEMAVGRFEDRPQFDRNTLQLNRGDGTFAEIAQYAGLEASDWTWSIALVDVDLDGNDDLLCATGHMFDTQDLDAEAVIRAAGPWRRERIRDKLLMFPKMTQAKVAFRNRGDLTFERVSEIWGFNQRGVTHGMALADLDNDGDLDVVVNNLNQPAGLYRNEASAPRIAVRLKGLPPNTAGIGAKIKVWGGAPAQAKEMSCGGRYLSGDDTIRVFAAGATADTLMLEVNWRGGKRSVVQGAKPNFIYEIDEAQAGRISSLPFQAAASPERSPSESRDQKQGKEVPTWFEDVSPLLAHTHSEDSFDDFARQPLLPRKLSQLGPGVMWFDYDGDGWDDLVVGSGAGGTIAMFRNNGGRSFARINGSVLDQPIESDSTGLVGFASAPSASLIIAGRSGYETTAPGPAVLIYDLKRNELARNLPSSGVMTGPLAMADIDGDGDLDLFLGGRCVPGKWPVAASSRVFLNEGNHFTFAPRWSEPFNDVGLVSGAVFADLDGDGRDDLLLAMEWGPLRLFHNTGDRFVDVSREQGLEPFVGWWNGVATGDFDGDGRLDIAASNWGWNTAYQSAADGERIAKAIAGEPPIKVTTGKFPILAFGDMNATAGVDIFEAEYDREFGALVPTRSRNAMAQGLPAILDRFPSYASYNSATLSNLVAGFGRRIDTLQAPWLASTVFLNRGHKFVAVVLPAEAQYAPAFGVCVADFDGDARDDIFLSQNFFEMQPTMPRLDAGRGLLLKGDGKGGFAVVPGQISGIRVYGEGRGAAAADYDGDGRLDLTVAQNGAATRLYRGKVAPPGLRVHLQGSTNNPAAIGAVARLIGEDSNGPAHCIQSGSGYWSQDSHALVLAKPASKAKLWVRWPGGRVTESEVPSDATDVVVDATGTVVSVKH